MTSRTMTAIAIALLTSAAASAQQAAGLSEQQRVSYALGMAQARSLQKLAIPVDAKIASQGFTDVLSGKPQLSDKEARAALTALQKEEAGKQTGPQKQAAAQKQAGALKITGMLNKSKGQSFLAENKAKPGVTTLASGLQYKDIQAGFGAKPTLDDTVSVNYHGKTIDGNEFGSTHKGGKPIEIAVKKMIPGWREALPLMQVGSKWEVVVPAELAYGERMPSRNVGPNSTLIFELELVAVSGQSLAGKGNAKENAKE
jgi:FKBP-type peptidyl-prolyl cis-trans isomerase